VLFANPVAVAACAADCVAATAGFGILQVPALVSQEGKRLRIDEVLLP
jgi:hypothetical protein